MLHSLMERECLPLNAPEIDLVYVCVSVCIRQRDERVEWLYSGAAGASVNREEYLLGKKIDRHVDPMLAEEEREKEVIAPHPYYLRPL